jgi:hypothetical protein
MNADKLIQEYKSKGHPLYTKSTGLFRILGRHLCEVPVANSISMAKCI